MGIADFKTRLRDIPGVENLTMQLLAGRQVFSLGGKIVAVDPSASEAQAEDAIRTGLASPSIAQIPLAAPSATLIPKVALATPQASTGASMSVTGATHAGASLKQMLAERRQKITAAHDKLQGNFAKLDQAAAALDTVGDKVGAEADDLMQTVGQFMNDLNGESTS